MPRSLGDGAAGQQADPAAAAVTKAGLLTSKFTGVCWNKKNKRWQASINSGGKYLYLGSFQSENDAAQMFDLAAIKLRGTKTKINFPLETYMDADGKLIENDALNATIAVHEQLVLTQKLATAQALALAGVTKKPRAGGGGAGTAAKKLTKANPASQGIITAGTAATDSSSRYASAAMHAAVTSSGVDQELLGHNTIAKHVNSNFDLALLQQAATSAAASAALATAEAARHQEQLLMQRHQQYLQGMPGFDLQQQQQQYFQEQSAMLMSQGAVPPMQQSCASSIPPAPLGQSMQQLPLDMQSVWNAGQGHGPLQSPAAGGHVGGLGQGIALEGHQQLQPHAAATRDMQLAALQGYLQDMSAGHGGQYTAAAPSSAAAYSHLMEPALPATAVANKHPAGSSKQHAAAAFDVAGAAHDNAVTAGQPMMATSSKHGSAAAAAAAAARNPVPLIRLSVLAQHVPAGGQLQLLVPGDAGLCGVIYSLPAAQADDSWGTALWDGSDWHAGGSFSSEDAATSACQFAVNFAKQLAVNTSPETVPMQQAAASAVPQQPPQSQQQPHSHSQQPAFNSDGNAVVPGAAAGHQRRYLHLPHNLSGSKAQSAAATTTADIDLEERSSLDDLAAAAAGALLEQQHMEWEQQQQQQQQQQRLLLQKHQPVDRTTRQHGKRSGMQRGPAYSQPPYSPNHSAVGPSAAQGATTASAIAGSEAAVAPGQQDHQLRRLEEMKQLLQMGHGGHLAARLSSGNMPASQLQQIENVAGVQQHGGQQQHSGDTGLPPGQEPYAQPSYVAGGRVGRCYTGSEQYEELQGGGASGELLQILQQVASGQAVTPQQSLMLLDSLKPLMGLGSGSYESLLFNILGTSSAAAPDEEAHLLHSQQKAFTPLKTAISWDKVGGVRSQTAHQPEATAPAAAAENNALDDCGIFGGEAGRAAAAVAAAAAVEATDSMPSPSVHRPSSLSPTAAVAAAAGGHEPAFYAGDKQVSSAADKAMEEPSVLGAYLLSMKAYEQQQHPQSEEQKSFKRRRISSSDVAQQTPLAGSVTQHDTLQQEGGPAEAPKVWDMSAAQGGAEEPANLKALPSRITDFIHVPAANVSSASTAVACPKDVHGSRELNCTVAAHGLPVMPPSLQPSATTEESNVDSIAEKASGSSLNSSRSLAAPVVCQAQVVTVDTPLAPEVDQLGQQHQAGGICPRVSSQARIAPRAECVGDFAGGTSTAAFANDQLASLLAQMAACGHEVNVEDLVSLLQNKQLHEWLAKAQ